MTPSARRCAASRFSSDIAGVRPASPSATGCNNSATRSSGRRDSSPMSTPANVTASASRLSRLPSHSGHNRPSRKRDTRFFISALWVVANVCST